MEKSIILNFPPKVLRAEKNHLTSCVNNALNAIAHEISAWNGFVDVVRNHQNAYSLIAIADDDNLRHKMQNMLEDIEIGAYCD